MKKIMALSLVCIIIFSAVSITSATVSGGDKLTVEQLMLKFPDGKFWNHIGGGNNPDGWTDSPCTHHEACGYFPDSCDCNSFENCIQCMGFARKLAYDAYGESVSHWTTLRGETAVDELKAGDYVRWYGTHSVWVYAVEGDVVTYADCNSGVPCLIKWNSCITKTELKNRTVEVKSAPYELVYSGPRFMAVKLENEEGTTSAELQTAQVPATQPQAESTTKRKAIMCQIGDANMNGKVSAADARLILRISAGLEEYPQEFIYIYDVNGNGKVTAADSRLLLRIVAQLE